MKRTLFFSALAAAALSACGDDAPKKAAGLHLGGSGSLEPYYAALLDAECDWLNRCAPVGPVAGAIECRLVRANFEGSEGPLLQAAVDEERLSVNVDEAVACLGALMGADCTMETWPGDACGSAFTGLTVGGDPCLVNATCATGAFCDLSASCPGVCRPRSPANSACEQTAQCSPPQVCTGGRCTAPGGEGDRCGGAERSACQARLICASSGPGQTPKCVVPASLQGATGDACNPDTGPFCGPDLVCQFDKLLENKTPSYGCAPALTSGSACTIAFPDPCPFGQACQDLTLSAWDVDGRCADLPKAGESCAMPLLFPKLGCADGTVCDAHSICVKPSHLGATCDSDEMCASLHCTGGVCAPADPCAPPSEP